MLVAALGVEDAALRAQIAATADGNPLFAEQLAAAVVETQGTSSLADVQLPASINALLEARLDGLGTPELGTLERAAVVGRVLAARGGDLATNADRPSVAGSLLSLARKGLIQATPSRRPAEDMYRFHHALIRDAAYAGTEDGARSAPRTVRRLAGPRRRSSALERDPRLPPRAGVSEPCRPGPARCGRPPSRRRRRHPAAAGLELSRART